uniref:Protein krueppel n=1 Tax=Stomoxys calcitrans TaxID=35570 RepID=A0A1I8PUI2_STOCA
MERMRCRICLKYSDRYLDLFADSEASTTYANNIRHLAEVELLPSDGLPQQICNVCCAEIENIIDFCILIRQSDELLRNEQEERKPLEGNVQILDNEEGYMQVCVLEEEVLDAEEELPGECHEMTIVESSYAKEEQNVEELQMVEEIIEVDEEEQKPKVLHQQQQLEGDVLKPSPKGPLEELAQVAATQQNVIVNDQQSLPDDVKTITECHPEDECDDNYLIVYNPADEASHNFKPPKWKCVECKKILRGDVSYEGHMNIHKQSRPHVCPECRCQFRCRNTLKKHKQLRHTKRLKPDDAERSSSVNYMCMQCDEECHNERDLLIHEVLNHGHRPDIQTCPLCPDLVVDDIVDHLLYVHARKMRQTAEVDENNLATTATVPRLTLQSKQCSSTEDNDIVLDENEDNMLENSSAIINCDVCNRKISKKNLKRHMSLHERKDKMPNEEDTNKFLCTFCPELLFYTSKDLKMHITTQHTYTTGTTAPMAYDELHECTQCEEIFDDATTLRKHEAAKHHIKQVTPKIYKDTKHICKECGNQFGGHAQLSAHKRLHKERPFKCDQCEKSYPRRVELEIHKRTHTGELPFACHLCNKRFAIKVRLTYHLQKHEGVCHSCDYCGATFDNRNKLKSHLFKHTGMPYKCELCPGVEFERRLRFANHMQRCHQRILTDDELAAIFAKNTGKTIRFKPADSKNFE